MGGAVVAISARRYRRARIKNLTAKNAKAAKKEIVFLNLAFLAPWRE
jgi:hypothetical protein